MEQIADEMDATLFRAAFNPIIAEAHDASHGLYHDAATGDTLVQGKSGLPIFVGVMSFAVKAVIDKAAADGDLPTATSTSSTTRIWAARICRTCGSSGPISATASLFCYLASVGHWHDVGGAVPGNYNPAATECLPGGLRAAARQAGAPARFDRTSSTS
jgi:N-methylhydantoinase B